MRAAIVTGSILIWTMCVGCAKVTNYFPPPNTATTVEDSAIPGEDETVVSEMESVDAAKREQELLTKLEQSPTDTKLLLELAMLSQSMARSTDDEYAAFKKSANYVHRALEADPNIATTDEFRQIAGEAFYNEACAFSREEDVVAGLKLLSLAVAHGWTDLNHLSNDSDLENVRKSPGYAAFDEMLQTKRRAQTESRIESLFADKHDFKLDFDLKDSEGQSVKMKDFAGKVLLVNVWGTWCPPCRRELPDLAAAYEKYKSQGFEIIGLNSESEMGAAADELIQQTRKEFGINYPCALAGDGILSQIPNLNGVPTSIFYNRQGKIQARVVGMLDKTTLEMIIERVLKESPAAAVDVKN